MYKIDICLLYSNYEGEPTELDLGDEVEYQLAKNTNKVSAEFIHKLTKGTLALEVSP